MSVRRPSAYRRLAEDQSLQFTEDGKFQISVFSDLHFAEGTMRDLNHCSRLLTIFKDDEADERTTGVVKSVLSSEEVQLVVLNGDLISGEATQSSNSSLYVDRVVAPLVDRDLPWASTYGNHDSEINLNPEEMFRQETKYRNSLTQKMVLDSTAGVTNYYLPIFPHEASKDSLPVFILWFFDSQGGHYAWTENGDGKSTPRQNWVDDTVIEWFLRTNSNLTSTYGQTIPSLAFVHIPVYAMRAFQKSGVTPTSEPGINGERVQQQGYDPDSGYHAQDFPFINALLNTTGLAATFSGHDHDNDWCFKWDGKLSDLNVTGNGLSMCYGRHTGYGGYGEWARGGRQILLDERSLGDDIRTWIRMEDGSISGDVHLNATYGHDRYGLAERSIMNGQNGGLSPPYMGVMYLWICVFYGLISGFHLW
ncbi:unnamed protein product [Penicillium egyptiacum]|uniref:Calcineurin-like phosphoesterase domain-containing protein n=1 Tax=Penicillium egyptiacum TaxID=1303716 RepID=A0A9W4K682_9EURO|nr:unnamed protein product [Penicillium egyptiacum]